MATIPEQSVTMVVLIIHSSDIPPPPPPPFFLKGREVNFDYLPKRGDMNNFKKEVAKLCYAFEEKLFFLPP